MMETDSRITDLEIKLTHAESTIDSLNTTAFEQQKQINDLTRRVELMQDYIKNMSKQMSQIADASEEAPPPHY
ncbi:MAG: SlyX family protein [Gammaproteobacteria bacterium]|nr:SlyX family protein [Gammaproteobacteria bacterium]